MPLQCGVSHTEMPGLAIKGVRSHLLQNLDACGWGGGGHCRMSYSVLELHLGHFFAKVY